MEHIFVSLIMVHFSVLTVDHLTVIMEDYLSVLIIWGSSVVQITSWLGGLMRDHPAYSPHAVVKVVLVVCSCRRLSVD